MTALKDLLQDGADRAKVYDVTDRALAGGRRRRRFRRAAVSGAFGTVVAGAVVVGLLLTTRVTPPPLALPSTTPSPSASATPAVSACTVARLPMPSGYPQKSLLSAGDPTGRFLGGRAYPGDGRDRLLLWDNGQLKVLPHQGEDEGITAINRHGSAVITAYLGDYIQSWVYHDGAMIRLKGKDVSAAAISDNGVIVGSIQDVRDHTIPVVWQTFTSEPKRLPLPDPSWSGEAFNVDSDGNIVGAGRIDQPMSTGRVLIWSPEGELLPMDRIPVRPNWSSGSMALFDAQVYLRANSEDFRETELWRIDLRSGLSTKLPMPDERLKLIAPNGWMVTEAPQGLVLVASATRVPLPDIDGHQRNAVGVLRVSNLGFMSWDGKTIGGYQSVPKDAADTRMEDIVAVVWRCQ